MACPFAFLSLLNHGNNPADGVFSKSLGGAYIKRTLTIDAAGKDAIAWFFFHGHTFSGHWGLIDTGPPVDDFAIGGNGLAWPDEKNIPNLHFFDRNLKLLITTTN